MTEPLVDVDDVASELHKTKPADLPAIQAKLETASNLIKAMCVPLLPATVTDLLDGGQPTVILSQFPVNTITSVTTYDTLGTPTVVLAAGGSTGVFSGWRLDTAAGVLHRVGWRAWPVGWGNIQVVYTVGPSSLPPEVAQATIELTKHLWSFRKVSGGPNQPGLPGDDAMGYSPSFAVPNQVVELLRPWLKPARVG